MIFSQKESILQASCLDDARGAAEERIELYINTAKEVPQAATKRIVKRLSRVTSFASKQAQPTRSMK
jgi:hypothetical protein